MSCPVCFAPLDETVQTSMNAGIFVLLGVTVSVLGGLAAFFAALARRARNGGPAEAGHTVRRPVSHTLVEERQG